MATLVTVTVTIDDGGTPAITQSIATKLVADILRVVENRTVTPTYSAAAVALAVT